MHDDRAEKLRQVVFERLILGEPREALLGELCRKLGAPTAEMILGDAVAQIAGQREQGTFRATAHRIRKRRLFGADQVWRNLGMLLLVGGGLFMVVCWLAGQVAIALGPILGGFLILISVEPRIRAKVAEADAAVDRLFEEAVGA